MKVLQVHNFYRIRGGECNVVDAERELLESHGHEVMQFIADSRDIDASSIYSKIISYLQIPWNIKESKRLDAYTKEHRPDIAHIHNVFPLLSPSVYATLKRNNVPIVQTVHNYRILCPNGLFLTKGHVCEECRTIGFRAAVRNRCLHDSYTTSALYAWAIRRGWQAGGFVNLTDHYIALNRFTMTKLEEAGIQKDKISICGNFVTNFSEAPVKKNKYALYLGRLSAEKGLRTLIDAAKMFPELPIKVAGTGPLEEWINKELQNPLLNHLEFVGYIKGDKKHKLLSEAICSVMPSEWYENSPLSVIESLAFGTPVVASRMGGLPELIEHGKNGLLFTSGDAADLAKCFKLLTKKSLDKIGMGHFALQDARERFSEERHLERLIGVYEQVLASMNFHKSK